METMELGGVRLRVATIVPGLPGEADRIQHEVAAADPALVLLDARTDEGLRLREALSTPKAIFVPSFVDGLFASEMARRFARGDAVGEAPMLAAARAADRKKASLVALRPTLREPGWLARRRARRAVWAIPEGDPDAFPAQFAEAMRGATLWDPQEDALRAAPRLERALGEGRAPILAILQAHRAPPLLALVAEARRAVR